VNSETWEFSSYYVRAYQRSGGGLLTSGLDYPYSTTSERSADFTRWLSRVSSVYKGIVLA